MKLAIGLITCDRPEYTKHTLESLAAHNDLSKFTLLHADDVSRTASNYSLANDYRFRSISSHTVRQGRTAMAKQLVSAAIIGGADWLLFLENDWECVRTFPWELFTQVSTDDDVFCLRLIGKYKEAGETRPVGAGKIDPEWKPYPGPEPAEIGHIHWASSPSIIDVNYAAYLLEGATREKDYWGKSVKLKKQTVRVLDNMFYHIGERTTEGAANR